METSSFIAMGIAIFAVVGLVVHLWLLNLVIGALNRYLGKPKLEVLQSSAGGSHFAFGFKWNSAREKMKVDYIRLKLFNPFGEKQMVDIQKNFEPRDQTFIHEVDMGPGFVSFFGVKNFTKAYVMVEVGSTKDGVSFTFEMKGEKLRKLLTNAKRVYSKELAESINDQVASVSKPPISIPERSFIADTVPGKGDQLAIPTNPAFEAYFQAQGGGDSGAGGADAPAKENFGVSKVWIEPGCIVCDACEAIYPEVFEVKADTCIIRPNAPLDNGLLIEEAAEACPVEVIKFTVAS